MIDVCKLVGYTMTLKTRNMRMEKNQNVELIALQKAHNIKS